MISPPVWREYKLVKGPLPQVPIRMCQAVYKAHEKYYATLAHLARDYKLDEKYRSNYGLPDMALRIAMLLASLRMTPRL